MSETLGAIGIIGSLGVFRIIHTKEQSVYKSKANPELLHRLQGG